MIDQVCHITQVTELASGIWQLTFTGEKIVSFYKGAGQFIEILGSNSWATPLRRPMSIAGVNGDKISIIFKVMGKMTSQLIQLKPEDEIQVLGPLGNTFSYSDKSKTPLLVGGGVGLAPVLNFYSTLRNKNDSIGLILGARTESEHFLPHSPEKGIYLTTDDGSVGIPGTVIPTLIKRSHDVMNPIIYACGPEPMLKAIQQFCLEEGIPAQLSVESYMGCGVGLCQGCVIRKTEIDVKEHSYQRKYSLVCKHGPVYHAKEIVFD